MEEKVRKQKKKFLLKEKERIFGKAGPDIW
jgi:hypothetical protein